LRLEVRDELTPIVGPGVDRGDLFKSPEGTVLDVWWKEVPILDRPRKPVWKYANGDYGIETQECEVGQVVFRQALGSKGGQDESQPAKPARSRAAKAELWQEDAVGISNDDMGNSPLPIDEKTDSSSNILRKLCEGPGELRADELRSVDPALVESPQGFSLSGLQPIRVAVQCVQSDPLRRGS
jgi:hypothetical protein